MSNVNRQQTGNKPKKLTDHFALLTQHENLSNMGMEGEDLS